MEGLVLIFKELCLLTGIVFMIMIICEMVMVPFKNHKKQKAMNEFTNMLMKELENKMNEEKEDEE